PVQLDIVAHAVGRKESIDSSRREQLLLDNFLQQGLRVLEQFLGLRTDGRVLENFGVPPAQLPGMEERRPVDERHDLVERKVVERPDTGKGRLRDVGRLPVDRSPSPARFGQGEYRLLTTLLVRLPDLRLI